ncbi:hypothetical protein [Agrobacterium vitis]|uniref:hypothetical protein n=1 Tax=Agrobacterium vitis TaxID=373 RepID=UPI0012E7CA0D|nr:hypothetical protein [Agrobacterium vitis]MUZ61429.1 hypothetical protein [Agrobacterium vitis]
MNKALQWLIGIWVAIAALVNVVPIAGMFMHDGFWGSLGRVQDTYSPFNIFNRIIRACFACGVVA